MVHLRGDAPQPPRHQRPPASAWRSRPRPRGHRADPALSLAGPAPEPLLLGPGEGPPDPSAPPASPVRPAACRRLPGPWRPAEERGGRSPGQPLLQPRASSAERDEGRSGRSRPRGPRTCRPCAPRVPSPARPWSALPGVRSPAEASALPRPATRLGLLRGGGAGVHLPAGARAARLCPHTPGRRLPMGPVGTSPGRARGPGPV